jgi:Glutamine phosphoribosylpyrophosphate amidotransferase
MCEIAVVPGSFAESNADQLCHLAKKLHAVNDDGLGVVAVYTDGDEFQYGWRKSVKTTPDWQAMFRWFQENSDAWRFVIHARLATAGGRGLAEAHPIEIVDDDVDSQYVIHNGSVRGARAKRQQLKNDGHEFNTTVDTEVIAHVHDDLPSQLDDDFEGTVLRGNLNYLLFGTDRILVRNDGKYTLTEDFTMTCRRERDRSPASEAIPNDDVGSEFDGAFALFKPDKSVGQTDASRKERTYSGKGRYTKTAMWGGYGKSYTKQSGGSRKY